MGDPEIDRGVFATPPSEPNPVVPRVIGLALFLVVLVVVGVLVYKFVPALTSASSEKPSEDVAKLHEQISDLQNRIDLLEKRRHAASEAPSASAAKPATDSAKPVVRTGYRVSPGTAEVQRPAVQKTSAPDPALANLQRGVGSLQTDVNANREAWQATADRLSDVVGEVGSQETEISQNREDVADLKHRISRNFLPFDLRKGADRQAVGPIALALKGTDDRNQRYTVRVLINDRWLEIKNLSLYEAVNLYVIGVPAPLELVATEIRKDEVSGILGVPQSKAKP